MAEQLRLFEDIKPQLPIEDPYKAYKKASPQVISGADGQEDVIVYNVKTDFQGLSSAHKKAFVPEIKTESPYRDIVPDISHLPKPSGSVLSHQERQQVINEGAIPEVSPFMAGARIALAEHRAKRQHKKAQSALRRVHVAHTVADSIVNKEVAFADPKTEFRPRALRETAMAKRMGRLFIRANNQSSLANIVEEMFTDNDTATTPAGEEQTVRRVDFDRAKENLSVFEKLHQRSARITHDRRRERSERLVHGQRIPIVDTRIGLFSFGRLAAGGPGNPIKKTNKALEKRDYAIRRAEALRRSKKQDRSERMATAKAVWAESWDVTKKAAETGVKIAKSSAKATARQTKAAGQFTGTRLKGGAWAELADTVNKPRNPSRRPRRRRT